MKHHPLGFMSMTVSSALGLSPLERILWVINAGTLRMESATHPRLRAIAWNKPLGPSKLLLTKHKHVVEFKPSSL